MARPQDRHVSVQRDPYSGSVIARGGDDRAAGILQRNGFVAVVRAHDSYHRMSHGLSEEEETLRAARAVGLLRANGYSLTKDPEFHTEHQPFAYLTKGADVANVAERIFSAPHTEDVTEALTELTASHDGILDGARAVLFAAAWWIEDLGDAADPARAGRLRQLADYLGDVRQDLAGMRDELADRHTDHPKHRLCPGIEDNEREASATCSCPPLPPRPPGPPAPPGRHR